MLFYLLMQLPDPLVQLPDPHVRLPDPLMQVETKQLLKLLLPIYKRIRSSKTTAYFENKLGRDDKKLVFIIRKHL